MGRIATWVVLLCIASRAGWCGEVPLAENLLRDGEASSRGDRPIVALISASDCHYCDVLKRNVLVGMDADERIILREIALDSPMGLIGFDGRRTDHSRFAGKYSVSFTPTVLFLDGNGAALAEPLVGVANLDFYLHYLERRIAQATARLTAQRHD